MFGKKPHTTTKFLNISVYSGKKKKNWKQSNLQTEKENKFHPL